MDPRSTVDSASILDAPPETDPGVADESSLGAGPARPLGLAWCLAAFAILNLLLALSAWLIPAVFAGYVWTVHVAERRGCRELRGGLRAAGMCVFGLALGAALWVVPYGPAIFSGAHAAALSPADLRYAVAPVALVAFAEEPIFRGLILRYAEVRLGTVWAIAISSVIFAAMHLEPALVVADAAVAGAVLGVAYVVTRRLWLSIGIHAGANAAIELITEAHVNRPFGAGLAHWMLTIGLLVVLLVIAHRRGALVSSKDAWAAQIGDLDLPVQREPGT